MFPFSNSGIPEKRVALPSTEEAKELADRVEEAFLQALAEKENSLTRKMPPTADMLREPATRFGLSFRTRRHGHGELLFRRE